MAALLLTGGASRRMGSVKALLVGPDGVALAVRTAALLAEVAAPVVEVGPGHTGPLSAVASDLVAPAGAPSAVAGEAVAGAGPLSAVAGGVAHLLAGGWTPGPTLVVATDLPRLRPGLLRWLAGHPDPASVVPVVDGAPQWLCARYSPAALLAAAELVRAGERRIAALAEVAPVHRAGPDEWSAVAEPDDWADVDTPAELAAAWGGL